jgi:hypothetical protein
MDCSGVSQPANKIMWSLLLFALGALGVRANVGHSETNDSECHRGLSITRTELTYAAISVTSSRLNIQSVQACLLLQPETERQCKQNPRSNDRPRIRHYRYPRSSQR